MRLIETKGRIAEDGSIILPPGVLETMCITTGDPVHLAYLSHHPVKQMNSYGEFFLTKEGIDHERMGYMSKPSRRSILKLLCVVLPLIAAAVSIPQLIRRHKIRKYVVQ